ncbi:MAG: HEAT repeat domain-containing protein [Phycisphaerales bacterium]|jgi:HEAT repeat protein|nr:HEAT repeat domain-containing protein [Phycisphaerales bacterium]
MKIRLLLLLVVVTAPSVVFAADKATSQPADYIMLGISKRRHEGTTVMSFHALQVHFRLIWLLRRQEYKYQESHASAWKACMLDEKRDMYARLCAAYFLLDKHEEARKFVNAQLASRNLRYRYNAAKTVELYVHRDTTKTWGINTLLKLLADGSIDGDDIIKRPVGKYPNGDKDDIRLTPINSICANFGHMDLKRAAPVILAVLERKIANQSAFLTKVVIALGELGDKRAAPVLLRLLKIGEFFKGNVVAALGKIGDKRAIPALLEILKKDYSLKSYAITALGRLKSTGAVPILIKRLEQSKDKDKKVDKWDTVDILRALLAIGDKRAVEPIKKYLKGDGPDYPKAVARRVLVQMTSADPVADLWELFQAETDGGYPECILYAMSDYRDDKRVVEKLSSIANTSDSASLRRCAIHGLGDVGNRQALLVLTSLLNITLPKDLKYQSTRQRLGFQLSIHNLIKGYLKECTKQDFGTDRAKWAAWIREHVKK